MGEGRDEPLPTDGYTFQQICHQLGHRTTTIHQLNGDKHLAFILHFDNQHPPDHLEIYCTSNLHLLIDPSAAPPQPLGFEPEPTLPDDSVPLFTRNWTLQEQSHSSGEPLYIFSGMFFLSLVEFLRPYSRALFGVLQHDFRWRMPLPSEHYMVYFGMKWAKVDLEMEETSFDPMVPLKAIETESVTERVEKRGLEGLSMGDGTEVQDEGNSVPA